MNSTDPKIASLREKIQAAHQEFDMAVMFHEVWKPSAYDKELHERMGVSYATNAFQVVRLALRREMLLALMRLWDKGHRAVRMEWIADTLRDTCIVDALAAERADRIGFADVEVQMTQALRQRADEVIALVGKYAKGGSHCAVLKNLQRLRHERLAHRQTKASPVTEPGATDGEIESFYQETSTLISLLLSLVEGVAYDPQDTAEVYRHYAMHFWAGVRGEKTEGHPNFRGPQ